MKQKELQKGSVSHLIESSSTSERDCFHRRIRHQVTEGRTIRMQIVNACAC